MTSTGDFSLNLFEFDTSTQVNKFLNLLTRQWLTPNFHGPARITFHDKLSFIDNVFLNFNDMHCCSGNLVGKITSQFSIL